MKIIKKNEYLKILRKRNFDNRVRNYTGFGYFIPKYNLFLSDIEMTKIASYMNFKDNTIDKDGLIHCLVEELFVELNTKEVKDIFWIMKYYKPQKTKK